MHLLANIIPNSYIWSSSRWHSKSPVVLLKAIVLDAVVELCCPSESSPLTRILSAWISVRMCCMSSFLLVGVLRPVRLINRLMTISMSFRKITSMGMRVAVMVMGGIPPGHVCWSSQPLTPIMRTWAVPNDKALHANGP